MSKKELLDVYGFKKSAKAQNGKNAGRGDLSDAYGKASAEKWRAWRHCDELRERLNGHGLRVIGANTFMFSAAFDFIDDDGNACVAYITPANNYFCMA